MQLSGGRATRLCHSPNLPDFGLPSPVYRKDTGCPALAVGNGAPKENLVQELPLWSHWERVSASVAVWVAPGIFRVGSGMEAPSLVSAEPERVGMDGASSHSVPQLLSLVPMLVCKWTELGPGSSPLCCTATHLSLWNISRGQSDSKVDFVCVFFPLDS